MIFTARLGTVCHNVLDEAVRTRILQHDDWRERVGQLWDRQLSSHEQREGPWALKRARQWPGYQLKRARLFHVAGRVRDLLQTLPAGAKVLTEQPLSAAGGRLFGRPDLLIRSAERHEIIDYKSGGVMERETNRPRDAYIRQLQLYAYLEHESTGSWPTSAHLFPLHGAPVEIDVEARHCLEVAAEALEILDAYNRGVPATPPASPAPEHCRWCPNATVCEGFWTTCDESWNRAILAVAGFVTKAFATPLGGITIFVETRKGTVTERTLVIKNIDPVLYSNARDLVAGDEVAATGLVIDERGSGYRLGAGGLFAVTRSR